jgi:ubiquinone biosynthesis protein COQ9
MGAMDEAEFDATLVASAFTLAAEHGWLKVSVPQAARAAGLPMARARRRCPGRVALVARFVALADQAALAGAADEGSRRDRLFDLMMRRIDFLQRHRAGVLALMAALPADPPTALALGIANLHSMGWMLEGADISAAGIYGRLRRKALLAVWLWTLHAWRGDDSEDLSATMAALDQALARAEAVEAWLKRCRQSPPEPAEPPPA